MDRQSPGTGSLFFFVADAPIPTPRVAPANLSLFLPLFMPFWQLTGNLTMLYWHSTGHVPLAGGGRRAGRLPGRERTAPGQPRLWLDRHGKGSMKYLSPLLIVGALAVMPAHAVTPGFDCARAEGEAVVAVCKDPGLAELDREMLRLFDLASAGSRDAPERLRVLVESQSDWTRRRDACRKSRNQRRCVQERYVLRIHELRQGYAEARRGNARSLSRGPLVARCEGLETPLGLTFVGELVRYAHLEWLDHSVVARLAPAGPGSRYVAHTGDGDFVLWVRGSEARFERPGREALDCRISLSARSGWRPASATLDQGVAGGVGLRAAAGPPVVVPALPVILKSML